MVKILSTIQKLVFNYSLINTKSLYNKDDRNPNNWMEMKWNGMHTIYSYTIINNLDLIYFIYSI